MKNRDDTQDHQCKFKRSQKEAFVTTSHTAMVYLKQHWKNGWWGGTALPWNEVNMYSGPGEGDLHPALMRNLLGLLTSRNGNIDDLHRLAARFGELGLEVPVFQLDIEGDAPFRSTLDHWDPQHRINLQLAPHWLKQVPSLKECQDLSKCTSVGGDCCAPQQLNELATCAPGYEPIRRDQPCFGFGEGSYRCCPLP